MLINTKFLGEVEINEEEVLHFEFGLPGFPEEKRFVLLPVEGNVTLALLQSVKHSLIGFVVAYPFAFKPDYAFDLSEEDLEDLQVEKPKDIVTYSIVTLKESIEKSTLNLLAPIVINMKNKKGKQVVLLDSEKNPLRYLMHALEGSPK